MKAKLAGLLVFLRARAAEPSTRAGISAFLGAIGAGLATTGSARAGLALFGASAVAGLNAAFTADPHLAIEAQHVAQGVQALAPVAAQLAKIEAPGDAAVIDAIASGVMRVADQVAHEPDAVPAAVKEG